MSRPLDESPRYPFWPTVGLVFLLLLAMGRVVANDFTSWDDPHTIWENPSFNPPSWSKILPYWKITNPHGSLWIPVTYTVWGVIAMGSYLQYPNEDGIRLNPFAFHAASLACHIVSTLLVYGLLRRALTIYENTRTTLSDLPMAPAAAWVGAALFAVHPLQVEAIAWTSGLKDMLSCMFSLFTVTCAAKLIEDGRRFRSPFRSPWFYLGLPLFLLGTMSKPSSMTAPALATAYCWLALQRPLREVLRTLWPWFLPVPLVMFWTKYHQSALGVNVLSLPYRPLVALDALAFYMGKVLLPTHLTFDYGRRPAVILQSGAIWWTWIFPTALAALVLRTLKRQGSPALAPVLAGLLMVIIAVSPVIGLTKFLFQYYTTTADHYFYPAMTGVALIAGWTFLQLRTLPWRNAAVAAVLLIFTLLSFRQMGTWKNSTTLYDWAAAVDPDNFTASNNRGVEYLKLAGKADVAGDMVARQQYAREAFKLFDAATKIKPEYSTAWDSKAAAQILLFDYAGGLQSIEKAMDVFEKTPRAIRQSNFRNRLLLARFLVDKGLYDRAISHLETALRIGEEEKQPDSFKQAVTKLLAEAREKKLNPTTLPTTQPAQPSSQPPP